MVGLLVLSACAIAGTGPDSATLTMWRVPTPSCLLAGIDVESDGTVYFAEFVGKRIGRLDPRTSVMTEWSASFFPYGITVSRSGDVYFTDSVLGQVGVLGFPEETVARENLSSRTGNARAIALAQNMTGWYAVWFAERSANRVGAVVLVGDALDDTSVPQVRNVQVQPTSQVIHASRTKIPSTTRDLWEESRVYIGDAAIVEPDRTGGFPTWTLPTLNTQYADIAITAHGYVCLSTEVNSLVMLDPADNDFRNYLLPRGTSTHGLTIGPAGRIWYTDKSASRISCFDFTSGELTEYQLPSISRPHDLVFVPDSAVVCFTEWAGNRIGALDVTTGMLYEFDLPYAHSGPLGISADPSMPLNIWFTTERGNYVGRLRLRGG